MPRKYEKKNMRKQWSAENMTAAIKAVRNKEMGYKKASQLFHVPRTTLQRMTLKQDISVEDAVNSRLGRRTVLNQVIEGNLVNYVLRMEQQLFGLTTTDIRRLAFQLAKRNGISNNFNTETEMAGKDWLCQFLARHPKLTLRSPESTSAARASAFNKANVNKFFDLLEKEMDTHKFTPGNIYNVDEKGITTVQSKNAKIIAMKGRKQVGVLSSAERGRLVTTVVCMSAGGGFVPPMFIFPRQRMKMELMDGAPPGSVYACHKTGWIQVELFTQWFKHFIESVNPSEQKPVLLILDGHASHVKNLEVIDLARENHVTMICLPPHCTHRMQPLDVSFMKPLTTYYNTELQTWLRSHPGRVVSEYQLTSIFGKAYLRAASLNTAVNGFQKTGIWPVNRNIFEEHEFLPSVTTDIPAPENNIVEEIQNVKNDSIVTHVPEEGSSQMNLTRAEDIRPYPVVEAKERLKKNRRRVGATVILTSTPYKKMLTENTESKLNLKPKSLLKSASAKKKINLPPDQYQPKKLLMKEKNRKANDDAPCIYCRGLFSEDHEGETWIMCMDCLNWAHTECAGSENENFSCDLCRDSD